MELPKSWNDITISKYQQILAIMKSDKVFVEQNVELALLLTNYSKQDILDMPLKDFKYIINSFAFLNEGVPTETPKNTIILNDIEFKVNYQYDKITSGQFVEMTHWTKDIELIDDNIHNIMATMCIGGNLDHKDKAQLFSEQMPITFANNWCVFFCEVMEKSYPIIKAYLDKKIVKMKMQMMEDTNE